MPWKELTVMSQRIELVTNATQEGINISELCRALFISRQTAYKWLERYQLGEGLADRSRRPLNSPQQTDSKVEEAVLAVRQAHPTWGGRKIHTRMIAIGHKAVPSPSTITEILRRHGLIDPEQSRKHRPWTRFEMEAPNQLWQADFKGYICLADRTICHPLTVLDDYSRYLVGVVACKDQRRKTVQEKVTVIFREHGLPERMLTDNGTPWGCSEESFTRFSAWLIRMGITVSHGRPYHPQTQGKDERVHRTLDEDLLSRTSLESLAACEIAFQEWRSVYNNERPHESLQMQVPASRYRTSPRPFPEKLPPIFYDESLIVRKADTCGTINFKNRVYRVGKAFCQSPVGLRPTEVDGVYDVYFCHQKVNQIDLRPNLP